MGGLCRSVREGGFTFDHAGHVFFTQDVQVDALYRRILDGNFLEHRRSSWVYLHDAYQRYPLQSNLQRTPAARPRGMRAGCP